MGEIAESVAEKNRRAKKPGYMLVLPWGLSHPGGVNQVVLTLDRELRRDGRFEPLVLVTDWEARKPVRGSGAASVVRYRLRDPVGPLTNPKAFLGWILTLPRTMSVLRRAMVADQIEVINVHYPTGSAVIFALMKIVGLTRARLVVSFHGQDAVTAAQLRGWHRWMFRLLLACAEAKTACSSEFARRVRELFPSTCSTVVAIHNGIDPDMLDVEISQASISAIEVVDGRYLLCVSSFVPKKALEVLIEAFRNLLETHGDLHLVIAGRSGPELERVRSQAEALGSSRVHLLVDVPHAEVTRLMRGATLFVLPSRDEPFGIVLLEAGVARLPVVATRVGGVVEIIDSPELGVLVRPDDPTELADAIRLVLSDPKWASQLADRLSQHVRSRFSATASARGYLAAAGLAQ